MVPYPPGCAGCWRRLRHSAPPPAARRSPPPGTRPVPCARMARAARWPSPRRWPPHARGTAILKDRFFRTPSRRSAPQPQRSSRLRRPTGQRCSPPPAQAFGHAADQPPGCRKRTTSGQWEAGAGWRMRIPPRQRPEWRQAWRRVREVRRWVPRPDPAGAPRSRPWDGQPHWPPPRPIATGNPRAGPCHWHFRPLHRRPGWPCPRAEGEALGLEGLAPQGWTRSQYPSSTPQRLPLALRNLGGPARGHSFT